MGSMSNYILYTHCIYQPSKKHSSLKLNYSIALRVWPHCLMQHLAPPCVASATVTHSSTINHIRKALLTKCQLFIVTCMGGPGQGPPFAAILVGSPYHWISLAEIRLKFLVHLLYLASVELQDCETVTDCCEWKASASWRRISFKNLFTAHARDPSPLWCFSLLVSEEELQWAVKERHLDTYPVNTITKINIF